MRETEPLRPGYARRLPPSDTRSFADASPADSAVIDPEPVGNNYAEPALFASTIQEERRPGGLRMWFVAAFFLVLGIGVGFASGYRVGQGGTLFTTQDATPPAAEVPSSPAATETSGRTFSESSVGDPVHLEPETIVPAPQPAPAPVPAPAPAPRAEPRAQRPAPPAAAPSEPAASGPGTLQVVSRPAGAQVYLDGRLVGRTPFSIPVEAGAHSVRLELPEFNAWTTTVEMKAGGSLRVAASLEQ